MNDVRLIEKPPAVLPVYLASAKGEKIRMQLTKAKVNYLFWPLVILVTLLGVWLRFNGQNWDEGQLLHPDERFVFMVTSAIKSVSSWSEYFNTSNSSLNPYNNNFGFYVYGTLPLFLWRFVADLQGTEVPLHLIGRSISASLDVLTCCLAFVSAWLLFGRWAGLIAFFISATSVLSIQLSHFAAFDSHGAFFTTAVLLLAILISKTTSNMNLLLALLAGVFCGFATATKINLVIVFGLVPLSLFLANISKGWLKAFVQSVIISIASLIFLAITFRIAQPYAFAGPGFFEIAFNPKWIENLKSLSGQAQGSLDFPPAVQWYKISRLHGILNLVSWGFGLPMGLLALSSLIFAGYKVVRGDYRFSLPFAWAFVSVTVYCLIFPVQTLRYGIPAYSVLAVLVAGMLSILLTKEPDWLLKKWRFWERGALTCFVFIGLGGSLIWAIAFTRVYRVENPRIAASRWMMREIPGSINFMGRSAAGHKMLPISIPGEKNSLDLPLNIAVWTPFDFIADKIFIPKLSAEKINQTYILEISKGGELIENAEITADLGRLELTLSKPLALRPGETLRMNIRSKGSMKASLLRTFLLKESSWDDGLPMRVDGFDPYGGIYGGDTNLEIYWRDGANNPKRFAEELVKADYFYLSSNRQVGTVGRLSKDFPVAALLYQKLLGCSAREYIPKCYAEAKVGDREGQLGFELVKTFESFPRIFGLSFNTQLADEAFQVYDHPRVLIFKNRDRLEVDQLQKLLTPVVFTGR